MQYLVQYFISAGFDSRDSSRKEVIHPQIPLRIPCYDLAFLTDPTLVPGNPDASGVADSANLTGGVCKARERIHRDLMIHGY